MGAKFFNADGRTDTTKLIVAIFIINQRDTLISQIYFWSKILHVSGRFSVHHLESSTVYTTVGICHIEIYKQLVKLLVYIQIHCS